MFNLKLNGEWQLSGGQYKNVKAIVPGCVHTDLLNAGLIEDPYYRDNELDLMWIGKTNWIYSRTFEIGNEILDHKKIILSCQGLDTFATISINGSELGSTDNMFRKWEFDIKSYLNIGDNYISIAFESTYPRVASSKRLLKMIRCII